MANSKNTTDDPPNRISIMQPYFFPYLGYFSLIAATDCFVVFDVVQYIRHGWVNRNRILKPDFHTPQYITVPLAKHSRATLIRDITIATDQSWREKILAQLQHYKKRAPNFPGTRELVAAGLSKETNSLVELNVHCLQTICDAIGISFVCQKIDTDQDSFQKAAAAVEKPGDWALEVTKLFGATSYINPIGGQEIFDTERYKADGIDLQFVQNRLSKYSQRNSEFVAGLSIIDVLMFNDLDATRQLIEDCEIV